MKISRKQLHKILREELAMVISEAAAREITWKSAPEYASLDSFMEFLLDDDRTTFTHNDLQCLNFRLRMPVRDIRNALVDFGFTLEDRAFDKRIRGHRSSSNDRWYGPGSDATHGGSGFDNF